MDASFYPILPSDVLFHDMNCQLFCELEKSYYWTNKAGYGFLFKAKFVIFDAQL